MGRLQTFYLVAAAVITLLICGLCYVRLNSEEWTGTRDTYIEVLPNEWIQPDAKEYYIPPYVNESSFTLVMLTARRTELMLANVEKYLSMERVKKVVLLWGIKTLAPPTQQLEELQDRANKSVIMKIVPEDTIRLRFHLYPEIDTSAIFSIDDDILLGENDLNHAFDIWKEHPSYIVGFSPRGHSYSPEEGYQYRLNREMPGNHSMILTNTAFLHRQYIRMFEDHLPQRVGQLIDKLQNCEDIAMNFLVASVCRCAFAAYVKTREKKIHYGSNGGLHGKPDHFQERSLCLDKFAFCFPTLPQKSAMFF